jgi:maltooligosyltrehalose trehalohydrolase
MDAQWSDDFHHALHSVITGERAGYYEDFGTLSHLARALQAGFVYANTHSRHRQRVHGKHPHDVPGWRFVVAAQNHDQVGNRATGERLAHLASVPRAQIAAALLLCAPFVPMLFQGEEWGASSPFQYFTAHEDAELGTLVSDGRRREFAAFGWDPSSIPDPQAAETFERSRLRWDECADQKHAPLLAWYRALLALRRMYPVLRDGNYQQCRVTWDEGQRQLVMRRRDIAVACNLGNHPLTLDLPDAGPVLLASTPDVALQDGMIVLPAESVVVMQVTPHQDAYVAALPPRQSEGPDYHGVP